MRRVFPNTLVLSAFLLVTACAGSPPTAPESARTPVDAPQSAAQDPPVEVGATPYIPAAPTDEAQTSPDRVAIAREPFILLDHPEMRGSRDLVIVAVGDVSQPSTQWVESVEALGAQAFAPTQHLVTGDINMMNLENPVTDASPTAKKEYSFTCPPHRLHWYLDAKYNFFSLANNHIADADQAGIDATLANLRDVSAAKNTPIWFAGAGTTPEEAIAPAIIELPGKDLKVAIFSVGFSRLENVGKFYDETLPDRIKDARKTADIVVVAVHAGREYQHLPDPQLATRYRGWVDAGAQLVVGHHPHVVQPVEAYKGGMIFYSLGNHVFASRTVRHRKFNARLYGMMARIVIHDGELRGAHLVPTWVNNSDDWTLPTGETMPNAAFAPKVLQGPFASAFFDDMDDWTRAAGTTPIERLGDVGVIRLPSRQPAVALK